MDIEPITLDQVKTLSDGRLIAIDNDVGGVAADLAAIDPTLKLRYSESSERFVVYQEWELPDGSVKQHLVTTSPECDQRLVKRVLEESQKDYAAELDKKDREADRAAQHRHNEQTGELAERLAFALRKELGYAKPHRKKVRGIVGYNGRTSR